MESAETFMREALAEARKAWGATHPNPLVGAVIVEAGIIVSRGHHAKAGGPHAEIEALNQLGRKPKAGAELYVTLEPCSSTGKTGPCTRAIIESGLRKVFVGAIDPDKRHEGRGVEILRSAGIETVTGVLESECEDLNLIFNHHAAFGSPFFAGKTATTLDGKVATRRGGSRWITGEAAREDVMNWRRYFPAIAVGSGTAMADNPGLTSRLDGSVGCGIRFVFDRRLRTRSGLESLQVFTDAFKDHTIVVTAPGTEGVGDFTTRGITTWRIEGEGPVFWASFGTRCLEKGVTGVYFEGGPALLSDLLAARQLNYLFAYRAPKFLADAEAPAFIRGQCIESMAGAFGLDHVRHAILGNDQLVRGSVKYPL